MPGYSFGISARECRTGGALAQVEGSICSKCYALKNFYVMPSTVRAHERRMEALQAALADPERADLYVAAWSLRIAGFARKTPEFRWFDSGDLQSAGHLRLIVRIAAATPQVAHWLPTKERGYVREYLRRFGDWRDEAPNLNIRVSDAMIGATKRTLIPGTTSSGAHDSARPADPSAHVCPAPDQGNSCGDCRACWNPRVKHVSYHVH
jgi:hypothetical protein